MLNIIEINLNIKYIINVKQCVQKPLLKASFLIVADVTDDAANPGGGTAEDQH